MKDDGNLEGFYEFVRKYAGADVNSLRLKLHASGELDRRTGELIQIAARIKTSRKLTSFLSCEKFVFPSLLSAEQATHQAVAAYHAHLIGRGHNALDMTAGLGIDSFAIALCGNSVTSIELDQDRYEALSHNVRVLGIKSDEIDTVQGDSIEWLREKSQETDFKPFDAIFIDPARRDSAGGRTYFFSDCLPNVVENYKLITQSAKRVYVKSSPIIDITQAIRELPDINEIHIVSVNGECKEVLCVVEHPASIENTGNIDNSTNIDNTDNIKITVVDLKPDVAIGGEDGITRPIEISRFEVDFSVLGNSGAPMAGSADIHPGAYVYDPNAGMHKLNAAKAICDRFPGLKRLAPDSDLYCSDTLHEDFPGRIFEVAKVIEGKDKKQLKGEKREIISRNHPLAADAIRKKFGLKPGCNSEFIIATRLGSSPILIDVTRL